MDQSLVISSLRLGRLVILGAVELCLHVEPRVFIRIQIRRIPKALYLVSLKEVCDHTGLVADNPSCRKKIFLKGPIYFEKKSDI